MIRAVEKEKGRVIKNIGEGSFYIFIVLGELSGMAYFTRGLLSIDLHDGSEEVKHKDI